MLLEGKIGLVTGIANRRSLAWGIAEAAYRQGATLALTYQRERETQVSELAQELGKPLVLPCDVTSDEDMDAVASSIGKELGGLDFMVHAVAFAFPEELDGEFIKTSWEGYKTAQRISSYSLTALAQRMVPLFEGRNASIVTLTYIGGNRVIPHYNVMGVAKAALEMSVRYLAADLGPKGVRVNAISAGPVKTLSASGVYGISKMLRHHRAHAPLRRNTDQSEVSDATVFLLSPLSRGITGEVLHVDNGFHILGMGEL